MGEANYLQYLSFAAALISVGAALYASRAWPIQLRKRLEVAEEAVLEAQANVRSQETRWTAHLAEFTDILENVEGALESIEKKRRRMAASESAAKRGGGEEDVPRYIALAQKARAQGLMS